MEHEIKLTNSEIRDLIDGLDVLILDQEDCLPDYKARVLIDSYESLKDRLKAFLRR